MQTGKHQVNTEITEDRSQEAEDRQPGSAPTNPATREACMQKSCVDEPDDQAPGLLRIPTPISPPGIVGPGRTGNDTDGQQGLFIPGFVEVNAIKEITSSMGRDAGTSINISQGTTAGQQLAADAGRSFIQGTSQYISKKMRTTKVTLKAGHRLLLMSKS